MIDHAMLAGSLTPLRELLQPDGADIALLGAEGSTALLRLELESAECTDTCVMPRPLLEKLALEMMQPLVPGLVSVTIEDPREA